MQIVKRLISFLGASLVLQVASAAQYHDFQVAQPPPVPKGAKTCTVRILQRAFANSYGHEEIVQLQPPTDCGPLGSWAAVTLNFTVTSNGTQYDRLGVFTFQNVEIWRTSTPEPSSGDGIVWTYIKDVTRYIPLFAKPGIFILELDNVVQTGLDGIYSTTLDATFYEATESIASAPKADLIVPISNMRNDTGNDVSVPPGFSLNVTLPQNSIKVLAEVYASGNGNEEFWYTNDGNTDKGPFREVRLLVDGRVAGVAYPYITVFTGGISPAAWRPITSYGALDLPTYFLDLTPFVPVFADGHPHNITIDVASAASDRTITSNWYLSGVLQVFTDSSDKPTTGQITAYSADFYSKTSTVVGTNSTVTASRSIHIESTIVSGSGETIDVVWSQALQYQNLQYGNNWNQTASGSFLSTHNGVAVVVDNFSYPFFMTYTGRLVYDHSYNRDLQASPIVGRNKIQERQTGDSSTAANNNVFSYSDDAGNTYSRTVNAASYAITHDEQSGTLAAQMPPLRQEPPQPFNITSGEPFRLPSGPKFHPK